MDEKQEFEIIALLYEILGKGSVDTLTQISEKRTLPLGLRRAAKELSKCYGQWHDEATSIPFDSYPEKDSEGSLGPQLRSYDDRVQAIIGMLSDRMVFPDRQSLIRAAKQFRIIIPASNKESRQRIEERITRELIKLPDERLLDTLSKLSGGNRDQTQGWFKLIRRSNA